MELNKEALIDKPLAAAWQVLGPQFGEAHRWGAALRHSEAYGTPTLPGATASHRACDVASVGAIKEVIRTLDPDNHVLSYEVIEGFPFFVDTAVNTWALEPVGERTRVRMQTRFTFKGFAGAVMAPLMKRQMDKLLGEALEEFVYYVEHDGEPHPRKVRASRKNKRPAVAA
ncbi:MAG: SRPBCC family protein [Catalinimonas sp.]